MRRAFEIGFVIAIAGLGWFHWPSAILALVATILVALYDKAGSLIEISFGPLRAKLEREVTEAEKLTNHLRELAAVQAKAAVSATVRTGRWAMEDDWPYRSAKQLERSLKSLDMPEETLIDVRRDLCKFTLIDLKSKVMGGGRLPPNSEAEGEWRHVMKKHDPIDPDMIEAFLRKWGYFTPARATIIDDMRWIIKHDDIRDVDQYMRSQSEIEWSE